MEGGDNMKALYLAITVSTLAGLGSCGKGLNSKASSDTGAAGFFLANAVFVDGTEDCGGAPGATLKFDLFTEFTFPDPDKTFTGFDYSACSQGQRTLAADASTQPANSEDIDETDPDSEAEAAGETLPAEDFLALCDTQIKENRGETFIAIGRSLGLKDEIVSQTSQTPSQPQQNPQSVNQTDGDSTLLTGTTTGGKATYVAGADQTVGTDAVGTNTATTKTPARRDASQTHSAYCEKLDGVLANVSKLDLSNSNISDLKPLSYLVNIRTLILSKNPIRSGAAASSMNLETLVITDTDLTARENIFQWKSPQR
jgi:hypothetical protein